MSASLYEAVGRMDGIRRLSGAFYERVLTDQLLAPAFSAFTPAHVEQFAVWLAEVFEGPAGFNEGHRGHQALLGSHLGVDIRDDHRSRWLTLMEETICEVLPGQPDLRKMMMAYFEWDSAIAQEASREPVGTDLGGPGPTRDGLTTD